MSLGRYGRLTGAIAVIWVVFISVRVLLPQRLPSAYVHITFVCTQGMQAPRHPHTLILTCAGSLCDTADLVSVLFVLPCCS